MAAAPRNPYLNRSMIRSVGEFYGRRRELQRILSRVGAPTPQSVSLVGERRMGKSSLLWHLAQPEVHAAHLDEPDRYLFLLLDFQGQQHLDQDGFCGVFMRHLAEAAGDRLRLGAGGGLDGVAAAVEAVDGAGLRLICLFDEFETVTRNDAFGPEFFGALRSLANAHSLAFVTACRCDLQSLCHSQQIRESPFFNIFAEVRVGPMPDDEIAELIGAPSAAAGVPLAPHEPALRRLGGNLPFFVQIACAAATESLGESGALDPAALEEAFLEEATPHFQYLWESFSDAERAVVSAVAAGDRDAADRPEARPLELQGYLLRRDGRPQLFSTAFARFAAQGSPPAAGRSTRESPPRPEVAPPQVEVRLLRNPYAVVAIIALAVASVALWFSTGGGGGRSPGLAASTLSGARVAAAGLAVEVQGEIQAAEGTRHEVIAVDGDHPAAALDLALRPGDRLRLALSARASAQVYAFVLRPDGGIARLPPHSTRPRALEPGVVDLLPGGEDWLEVEGQPGAWAIVIVAGVDRQRDLEDMELRYLQADGPQRAELARSLAAEIRSRGAVAVSYTVAP